MSLNSIDHQNCPSSLSGRGNGCFEDDAYTHKSRDKIINQEISIKYIGMNIQGMGM